ncbi:MAG TPA: DNA replication/repair protein RecF [Oligoflexia bacterium]|nr:DNA replication/repair protein RecF [Oligoflexia bacterium]HMP48123.1 DNA replication/repair protein RecF [Oligoflexia bacterium]
MYLKQLEICNIRNLKDISLSLSPGISVITGNNGEGKTSILESIFLLSHARSFRTSSLKEVVSHISSDSSFVKGEVESSLGNIELSVSIEKKNNPGGKRYFNVNNKNVRSASEFCGRLKTVLFTPEDLELVKGGPVIRRQFIDRVLVMLEPSFLIDLSEYTKIVKSRNRLLIDGDFKSAILFNEPLLVKNIKIAEKRLSLVLAITERVSDLYKEISGSQSEHISISYRSSFVEKGGELCSLEKAREIMSSSIQKDMAHKRTCVGIHRDDVPLSFKSAFTQGLSRVVSSQGQVRLIALCCKLASAELISARTGERPVLLLDDVDAELDQGRSLRLYSVLMKYPGQILLTGTEPPLIFNKPPKKTGEISDDIYRQDTSFFRLDSGALTELIKN